MSQGASKSDLLKKCGFVTDEGEVDEEIIEIPFVGEPNKSATWKPTGFPKPVKRYQIVWESHDLNLEEPYYWVHLYYEHDLAFHRIIKTEDVFAAAENSAFFGVSQQRLGAQQDKISQYLATIGKMVKELFQLVRELRILDERIIYYADATAQLERDFNKREKASEITLKGIFIDLVEGGAKNAASVYGMARELEFTTLPDLFFDAPPMKHHEVDNYVNNLDFNRKVLEVLKRHLTQFVIWKERTWSEINTRRRFTLQYLRQHYEIIKMYMTWVKPYLRHVQRLTMMKGFQSHPEIVSAFESSLIDVEIMGVRKWKTYNTVIISTFNFHTHPGLKFVQEGYQRGPIHVGKMVVTFRGYVWTEEQIQNYIKYKDAEDFELLKTVSGAVQAAMDALGDELLKYLEEAGSTEHAEPAHAEKTTTFNRMFMGILGPKKPDKHSEKHKKEDKFEMKQDENNVRENMKIRLWLLFKNFKKGHGMMQW